MGDDNIIELDDFRPIWEGVLIEYLCCNYMAAATFKHDAKELECPLCHKMTEYTVTEGTREDE